MRTKILEAQLKRVTKYIAHVQTQNQEHEKDLTDLYSELLPVVTRLQTKNRQVDKLFPRLKTQDRQLRKLFIHLQTWSCKLDQGFDKIQTLLLELDKVTTRLQNENLKFDTELRNIDQPRPASPNSQSNFEGTGDHSPSSGIPDTIDENPSSASNQNVSGRYSDSETNEVVMDTGPAGSPLQLSIGEDQKWIFKEDQIVNWPLFYNQASLDLLSTQAQVEFAGKNATVFTTHRGLYNPTVWVPLLKGSTWPYGNNSGQFTGTF